MSNRKIVLSNNNSLNFTQPNFVYQKTMNRTMNNMSVMFYLIHMLRYNGKANRSKNTHFCKIYWATAIPLSTFHSTVTLTMLVQLKKKIITLIWMLRYRQYKYSQHEPLTSGPSLLCPPSNGNTSNPSSNNCLKLISCWVQICSLQLDECNILDQQMLMQIQLG